MWLCQSDLTAGVTSHESQLVIPFVLRARLGRDRMVLCFDAVAWACAAVPYEITWNVTAWLCYALQLLGWPAAPLLSLPQLSVKYCPGKLTDVKGILPLGDQWGWAKALSVCVVVLWGKIPSLHTHNEIKYESCAN